MGLTSNNVLDTTMDNDRTIPNVCAVRSCVAPNLPETPVQIPLVHLLQTQQIMF